jgi:hypothetical protein
VRGIERANLRDETISASYFVQCIGRSVLSPIPAFDARGFLPPYQGLDGRTADRSPYATTMTELVQTMGTTLARRDLLKGLLNYRALLVRLGYGTGLQFINGSFAENVEMREGRPPKDIDVFSILARPPHYRNDPILWARTGFVEWQNEIANYPLNKTRFGVDTYAIAMDQHDALTNITSIIYWYSLFAHKRITHDWKGFLSIPMNSADDAAALSLL